MMCEKTWHAVYTRPGCETKVAALLTKKNIENYCPLNKPIINKRIFQPLFNTYVFVRIHETDQRSIKQVKGILNFVYWLGKPALIADNDIQAIRKFLTEHATVQIGRVHDWIDSSISILLPSLHTSITASIRRLETPIVHLSSAVAQIRI